MVFPYSIRWMACPADSLPKGVRAQVMIATSKKKLHHAVDRNRIKRLTRECYRLHKPAFYAYLEQQDLYLILSINYIHNEKFDYKTLYHKFDKIIDSLGKKFDNKQNANQPCQ